MMPALTIPSPTRGESPRQTDAPATGEQRPPPSLSLARPDEDEDESRNDSPERPPESPISPSATFAELPKVERKPPATFPPPKTAFMNHPMPVPVSESTDPDAAALRSTISLLQMQRERSKRDIQTLERIKNAAVADPVAFKKELVGGRLKVHSDGILGPTLAGNLSDADEDDASMQASDAIDATSESKKSSSSSGLKFPPIPIPQNVVRTPAINWDKYAVVGPSLDKLHKEQQERPSFGGPLTAGRAPENVIAAPYSVFSDRLDSRTTPTQRKETKKST